MRIDHDGCGQRGNHFLGDLLRTLVHGVIAATGEIFENHCKFIAAQSRHGVAGTHAGGQPRRHTLQQFIPDIVTERIINGFEAIQIDEHERQTAAVARGIGHALFKPVVDQHAIGQTCQRIAGGKKFNTFFGTLSLGDIGRCAGHPQRATARVAFGHLAL